MANGTKDGYVTIGTFENKLWKIKGDMDVAKDELKNDCKERKESTEKKIVLLQANDQSLSQALGTLRIDLAKVVSDVDWLKRFFWIVVSTSIGAMVASIITMVLTYKQ